MLTRLLISVSVILVSASFAMEQRASSTSQNTRKLSLVSEIQISSQDEGTISGIIEEQRRAN